MNAQQRQAQECARLFVKHRDAKKIARALSVTERTIYNIIKRPAFHTELDALGYEGIRKFERKASKRGKSQKHDKAHKLWDAMQQDGTPRHKQAGIISEELNSPIQTVRAWIRDWRKNDESDG